MLLLLGAALPRVLNNDKEELPYVIFVSNSSLFHLQKIPSEYNLNFQISVEYTLAVWRRVSVILTVKSMTLDEMS